MNPTPLMSTTTVPLVLPAHLAANRDDGVGLGVLLYADLEVHADPSPH
jgi:hypothetical protein